ncbi:MAG TPA: TonB family protein [Chitinophagaceae bacterium]|nr:TonB family protein [Chitinophagaceae bacterium]
MITQDILTIDALDILFENRNKAYGAYALRKHYDKRLLNSLAITLFIAAAICLLSFKLGKKSEVNDNKIGKEIVTIIDIKPPPIEEKRNEEKGAEKPVKQTQKIESVKATDKINIVPDNQVTPNDTVPDQMTMENKLVSTENSEGDPFTSQVVNPKEENKGNNGHVDDNLDVPNTPFDVVDIPPTYPGGIEALQNFLRRNLRTPDELESGQIASVKIKFVINANGELHDYQVTQSAGGNFDNEVIRVLKKMPRWTPGKYKGVPVSVYYVIPVKFEAFEE